MDLWDVIPAFQIVFFGILPSMLLLVFAAILYKLLKKGRDKLKNFGEKLKKGEETEKFEGSGKGIPFYMKAFHDVVDFIFSDALVAIVIVLPIILMTFNFLFANNSEYMLEHFWDYAYPSLAIIVAVTALEIWSDMLYKFAKTFGLKKPKGIKKWMGVKR